MFSNKCVPLKINCYLFSNVYPLNVNQSITSMFCNQCLSHQCFLTNVYHLNVTASGSGTSIGELCMTITKVYIMLYSIIK